MPTENPVRVDDGRHRSHGCAFQSMRRHRERPSLEVGKAEPLCARRARSIRFSATRYATASVSPCCGRDTTLDRIRSFGSQPSLTGKERTVSSVDDHNEAELGWKIAAVMKANAASRVCGLLTARGRSDEWEVALEHIRDHFVRIASKPTHSVFRTKYRDPDTLKDLLKRAASSPSTVVATRATLEGNPSGRPCVKIVRQFGQPVGEELDQVCVVLIVDHGGTLMTAYPATTAVL